MITKPLNIKPSRLGLYIDVFDNTAQYAEVTPELMPSQLIEAILEEFQEIEYLSASPSEYQLLKFDAYEPLDEKLPLNQQIVKDTRLMLVEQDIPLPEDKQRPSRPIYLREQQAGKVYKLHWLPAIIGRRGQEAAEGEEVAVNLSSHRSGLRVSRRHAQISEEHGQFYIESLSSNPASVEDSSGKRITLPSNMRHPLQHSNYVYLERSDITLKFIVRKNSEF